MVLGDGGRSLERGGSVGAAAPHERHATDDPTCGRSHSKLLATKKATPDPDRVPAGVGFLVAKVASGENDEEDCA